MNGVSDIGYLELGIGLLLFLVPIFLFWYFKVGVVKDTLIAILRMLVQLALVAIYLEWVFKLNSPWINGAWVFLMIFVGLFTTMRRVGLKWRYFIFPLFIAGFTSLLVIDAFFLGLVIRLDNVFDARYFVPISGMILGNSMKHNIVGLNTYFSGIREKTDLYYFLLINTGKDQKALKPFIAEAIRSGMDPLIAVMAVIGLISLPGMMTGQILGGSSPEVAIKYQILIMIAIFVGCTLNLVLSILISNRFIFDKYGRTKDQLFKKK